MGNIYSSSEVFKNLYDPGGLVGPRGSCMLMADVLVTLKGFTVHMMVKSAGSSIVGQSTISQPRVIKWSD